MQVIKESSCNNLEELVGKLAKEIKNGKVLICLTDTIYGLIGDATSEEVVSKIFKIKKRTKSKSLPVFVRNIGMAKKIAIISKEEEEILKKIWPGPVTVVLKRKENSILAPSVFGRKKTIGLRVPNWEFLNKLLKVTSVPLVATSANLSGRKGGCKIKDIIKEFKEEQIKPDIILDSGNAKNKRPSTVIFLKGKKFKILREGCFSKEKLSAFLKRKR
ncbi:threonylcarbamoyl-AMP synthase [bacterium]|nr:threonylcarbamoyl-AMP synthase [bacterium]